MVAYTRCVVFACIAMMLGLHTLAQALSRSEFEAQARPLMSSPAKAELLLALCEKAMIDATHPPDNGADDGADGGPDAGYQASVHGFASHAFWLTGKYDKAESEARQALVLDNQDFAAYFFLTDALNAQGKYDEAYRTCLFGAEHRAQIKGGPNLAEARSTCRADYLGHLSLSPETVLAVARSQRLPVGKELLIKGRIADIRADTLIFTTGQDTMGGTVECTMAAPTNATTLAPMTDAERGRTPAPTQGLSSNMTVFVQGTVSQAAPDKVRLQRCTLVPQ